MAFAQLRASSCRRNRKRKEITASPGINAGKSRGVVIKQCTYNASNPLGEVNKVTLLRAVHQLVYLVAKVAFGILISLSHKGTRNKLQCTKTKKRQHQNVCGHSLSIQYTERCLTCHSTALWQRKWASSRQLYCTLGEIVSR